MAGPVRVPALISFLATGVRVANNSRAALANSRAAVTALAVVGVDAHCALIAGILEGVVVGANGVASRRGQLDAVGGSRCADFRAPSGDDQLVVLRCFVLHGVALRRVVLLRRDVLLRIILLGFAGLLRRSRDRLGGAV